MFIILLSIFSFTYLVDPFGINNLIKREGFNQNKAAYALNTRRWKVFNALSLKPEYILFGASPILSIKPEEILKKKYKTEKIFNFGHNGSSAYEHYAYIKFSIDNFNIKKIYYEIDLINLIERESLVKKNFDKEFLEKNEKLFFENIKNYLSFYSIKKSFDCLKQNNDDPQGEKRHAKRLHGYYNKYGSRTNKQRFIHLRKNGEKYRVSKIKKTEKNIKEALYLSKGFDSKNIDALDKSVQLIRSHNIEYIFLIVPKYINYYKLIKNNKKIYSLYKSFLNKLVLNNKVYLFTDINIIKDKTFFWDNNHAQDIVGKLMFNDIENITKNKYGKIYNKDNIHEFFIWLDDL